MVKFKEKKMKRTVTVKKQENKREKRLDKYTKFKFYFFLIDCKHFYFIVY